MFSENSTQTAPTGKSSCLHFSCDQAALWMVQSVRLSVCPSVTPVWLCSHHRIITKFSGVITNGKSDVHAKVQGQRSKVKVTEVKKSSNLTQIGRFRTVTLNSPMATKWWTKLEVAWKRCPIVFQGYPSNCKVTQLLKNVEFDPNWAFPDCNSSLNSPMATKWCTKLEVA